jgi:hypothetical protein
MQPEDGSGNIGFLPVLKDLSLAWPEEPAESLPELASGTTFCHLSADAAFESERFREDIMVSIVRRFLAPTRAALFASAALVFAPTAAMAQDTATDAQDTAAEPEANDAGIKEIVVTAQRREERLQDVPLSITAISGEEIRNADVRDITRLEQVVPGLRFGRSGPAGRPAIRGTYSEAI